MLCNTREKIVCIEHKFFKKIWSSNNKNIALNLNSNQFGEIPIGTWLLKSSIVFWYYVESSILVYVYMQMFLTTITG